MVRFKVVKGSHLLLAFAVMVLALAIVFILLQENPNGKMHPASSTQLAVQNEEAKAISTFASDVLLPLKIEILPDAAVSAPAKSKKILIYHTHTHEAYAQEISNPYDALEAWRTADESHSVVRLGTLLAEELRSLGYEVIHDATDHEADNIDQSYVRALNTLEEYDEDFDLCIDLHRDAYSDGMKKYVQSEDGTQYAQMMMLIGRGDLYDEEEKPDYENNLEFAQKLTNALNTRIPQLCRNVTVKQGRYNQHIGRKSILVEVGHNLNTLEQAIASIPHLAGAIDHCLKSY